MDTANPQTVDRNLLASALLIVGILATVALIYGMGYSLHSNAYYGVSLVQQAVPMFILKAFCVLLAFTSIVFAFFQEWRKFFGSTLLYVASMYFASPSYLSSILF